MGVFKVGKSYYFRFRFHGRRIKRSVGRVSKYLAQQAEQAERRKLAEEYVGGRWKLDVPRATPLVPTLKEYVEQTYLPTHLPRVAPSSQRQYRSLTRKLSDALGHYRLDEFGPKVLDAWSAARLSGTEGLRRVSAAQVVNDGRALAAILNHAIKQRVIATQPMHGWSWPKPDESAFHIVTAAEERALLRAASREFASWIVLALSTGLRKGELRILETGHVHADRAELRLPQPKVRQRVKVIPLAPRTLNLLRRLISETPRADIYGHIRRYVLPAPDGQPRTVTWVNRQWKKTRKRAKLRGVRFHDLRHTFATRALEVPGSSVPVVGDMLGHKPPLYKQTWRYVHVMPEAKRKVILGMAGGRRR